MATSVNYLDGVHVGDYGYTITVTLKDTDGTAQDVSAYTTSQKVHLISPDKSQEVTETASFNSDGSDGKVDFSFSSGTLDREGIWEAQVELKSGSATRYSHIFEINVKRRLGS